MLEAMEDILSGLQRSLDGRVYVAVGRGLWDFTSKEIYDYVDSLQEGKENKVRQQGGDSPQQGWGGWLVQEPGGGSILQSCCAATCIIVDLVHH